MARKLKSDKFLFIATLLLVSTSVVMVYSASAVIAMEKFQQPYFFLFKQAAWALVGICLVPIVMRIDYRNYRQPIVIWTALGLAALTLGAVLFGRPVKGATRWLDLGLLGVQPSEFAKLAVIVFTAALLERRMERIDDVSYSLLPIVIVVGVMVGLILAEPDLGTAVSVLMIASDLVFAAGIGAELSAAQVDSGRRHRLAGICVDDRAVQRDLRATACRQQRGEGDRECHKRQATNSR